jgi:hypothetical protein
MTLPPVAVAVMQSVAVENLGQKLKATAVVVEATEYSRAMSQFSSVDHDSSVMTGL